MEYLIVITVTIFFIFLNSLNYIAGVLATAKDSFFLGTVHWPGDYFYYLSQFAQGSQSWFTSYDLYTSDFPNKTPVGWVNVFLGRIFYLLGINQFLAYQLSIVIFSAAFLILSFFLIKEIFPDEAKDQTGRLKRMVAFILFVASNAFPKIEHIGGQFSLSYFDFWFNNGLPFTRLVGVPHQLIGRASISLALLLGLWWWKRYECYNATMLQSNKIRKKKNEWRILFGLLLVGFVLASIDPVHWGLVAGVLFLVSLPINGFCPDYFLCLISLLPISLFGQRNRQKERPAQCRFSYFSILGWSGGSSAQGRAVSALSSLGKRNEVKPARANFISPLLLASCFLLLFLPALFFFLGGLPMALYLKSLLMKPPYMQLAAWEATQQVRINLWQFILGNGPVVVLAIFGLPFFIQKITTARLIALLFTFLTLGLYFSPIPQQLSIVNVRFLPATTTLFFACFASQAVYQLALRFKRKQGLTAVIITGLIICILVSTYFVQIQNKIKTDTTNGFYYIAKKAYDAQNFTRSISSADDTFLVIWPFNWSFPAITGRRVFEGHSLLTIDYEKKAKQASDFFFGQTEEKQMQELLDREKIDYIVAYPWTRNMDKLSKVKKIYDNGYMAVYRVEPK